MNFDAKNTKITENLHFDIRLWGLLVFIYPLIFRVLFDLNSLGPLNQLNGYVLIKINIKK